MATVLLVDDDQAVRNMLAEVLSEQGHEICLCKDGKHVLETLQQGVFDVLILDILLPHKNGFVLLEEIRQHWHDLPIILMSGIYRSKSHRAAMMEEYNVVDYLDKPIKTDRLLDLVAKVPIQEKPANPEIATNFVADAETCQSTPGVAFKDEPEEFADPDDVIGIDADNSRNQSFPGNLSQNAAPPPGASSYSDVSTADIAFGVPKEAVFVSPQSHKNKHKDSAPYDMAEELGVAATQDERKQIDEATRTAFQKSAFLHQGSINRRPVAAVLGKLWHERASGALLLRQGKIKKIVHLKRGEIVLVKSNLVSECLGQVLLRERLIDRQACVTSIHRMKQTKQRQGEILVDMGCITPNNLRFALELQMETRLFEPFSWNTGEYRFNAAVLTKEKTSESAWSTPALVTEGIRRTFDEQRLRDLMVPILDVPLVFGEQASYVQSLGLTAKQQKAVAALNLPKTSREILETLPLHPANAIRIVYTLIALEMLRAGV